MKRYLLLGLALLLPLLGASWANATQGATPCAFHGANPPTVDYIAGASVLQASGGIGGCPKPSQATITVNVQHLEAGTWVTKATGTSSRAWAVSYRYARQLYVTLTTDCLVGEWRTQVTGGDGYAPTAWTSPTVTFTPGDSGVCGSYGGGD